MIYNFTLIQEIESYLTLWDVYQIPTYRKKIVKYIRPVCCNHFRFGFTRTNQIIKYLKYHQNIIQHINQILKIQALPQDDNHWNSLRDKIYQDQSLITYWPKKADQYYHYDFIVNEFEYFDTYDMFVEEDKKKFRSKGGGLMGLVSYASQDTYLTGNPQLTYFRHSYRQSPVQNGWSLYNREGEKAVPKWVKNNDRQESKFRQQQMKRMNKTKRR